MMDFSNEPYVRVYTRDTTTWKRLQWEGQCVLVQLLRKVDRAGVLELGDMDPAAGVHLHLPHAPIDFIRIGVARMLELGVVTYRDGVMLFPRFLEGQEASKSDKQRQRESRERRRTLAAGAESQKVTGCHELSQAVTASHTQSQAVTLCFADPDPDPDPGPMRDAEIAPISGEVAKRRLIDHIETYFPEQARALRNLPAKHYRKDSAKLADWCLLQTSQDAWKLNPTELAESVIDGYLRSESRRKDRWPLQWAAYNPPEFLPLPKKEPKLPLRDASHSYLPANPMTDEQLAELGRYAKRLREQANQQQEVSQQEVVSA